MVLDGAAAIPADQWKLVDGCKNVYWAPFESQDNRRIDMVFVGGEQIGPTLKNIPGANSSQIEGSPCDIMPAIPGDTPNEQGFYHDQKAEEALREPPRPRAGQGRRMQAVQVV